MNKSLRLLAGTPALLAIGLTALNDFVLKPLYPSWLTGKLSDAAVLFFLPLLASGVIALALPRRWRGREALAAWLGYGLTLAGYLLLKSSAASAAWLAAGVTDLTGFHLRALADPGDLLALPFLALSAWQWARTPAAPQGTRPLRWRLLLVPLAALVALADAAMPDLGVDCLSQADGALLARGGYSRPYASGDGGMTWAQAGELWSGACGLLGEGEESLVSLPDGSLAYRIRRGGPVERSTDGGQTWQAVAGLAAIGEAEEAYVRKTRSGNLDFASPPLDALLDPDSGNLLLAMGQQGVLLVRPDGSAAWASVGPYRRESLRAAGFQGYTFLLTGEMALAGLAGLIWMGTLALARRRRIWLVVSVLAGLALLAAGLSLHPTVANDAYLGMLPALALLAAAILALALVVGAAVALKVRVLARLPLALLLALVVLFPYVLWALSLLPRYWMAQALAGGLLLAWALAFGLARQAKPNGQ